MSRKPKRDRITHLNNIPLSSCDVAVTERDNRNRVVNFIIAVPVNKEVRLHPTKGYKVRAKL